MAVQSQIATETALILFGRRGAQSVVLKVGKNPGDESRAGQVLAAFQGRGAVRIFERSEDAILLERAIPGTPLVDLVLAGRDQDATDILADVIASLTPEPRFADGPTVEDWAISFERSDASGMQQVPEGLRTEAKRVYLELCRSQSHPLLLHGDLHHGNVLFDADRGWLTIDPKGVVGEREYELGASLRNPTAHPDLFARPHIVERRLQQFGSRLSIDPGRALAWAFAQAVLSAIWTVEDGEPVTPSHPGLLLAGVIRPRLGG